MNFIALFVVVAAIVALSFASAVPGSLGKRQSGCPPPPLTDQCTDAFETYGNALQTFIGGTSEPSTMDRDTISDSLDTICGTCYEGFVAKGRCANIESFIVSGVCGRSDAGTRCSLAFADSANRSAIVSPSTCGVSRADCTADCINALSQIRSDLGCCAASLFNTTGSPLASFGARYDMCDVRLGTVCDGQSGAAGLIYMSATLLVAISAISASIL